MYELKTQYIKRNDLIILRKHIPFILEHADT